LIEQLLRAAQESLARVPEKEVEASETADEPRQLGWYLVLHVSHLVARRCVKMSKPNLPTCKMLKITITMSALFDAVLTVPAGVGGSQLELG
jgi:hypothetical protein